MSDPINAACHTGLDAAHKNLPVPRPMPPKLVVLHDTEGGSAESIAHYFTSASSGGSAQLVVDDDACYRCLPDNVSPWGAPGANLQGVHIEMCGYAKWSSDTWHTHEPMLHRAAFKVAAWCKEYAIPVEHLSVADLKAGKKGIVTHADVSAAWHLTDHTDPGPGFPMTYFLGLVKAFVSGGQPQPKPKPEPAVKHWGVTFTDDQGKAQTRGPWTGQDVDEFRARVSKNHADDAPTDPPVIYIATFYPAGAPG